MPQVVRPGRQRVCPRPGRGQWQWRGRRRRNARAQARAWPGVLPLLSVLLLHASDALHRIRTKSVCSSRRTRRTTRVVTQTEGRAMASGTRKWRLGGCCAAGTGRSRETFPPLLRMLPRLMSARPPTHAAQSESLSCGEHTRLQGVPPLPREWVRELWTRGAPRMWRSGRKRRGGWRRCALSLRRRPRRFLALARPLTARLLSCGREQWPCQPSQPQLTRPLSRWRPRQRRWRRRRAIGRRRQGRACARSRC
mmetsp:Transcript_37907/g.94026  ORF Transcript_37907/g.94026 Transcript_37907/m.94026 type:complete len:252 (+) Transcript_37907:2033-2788(+)